MLGIDSSGTGNRQCRNAGENNLLHRNLLFQGCVRMRPAFPPINLSFGNVD
jgi:hypothetical protein